MNEVRELFDEMDVLQQYRTVRPCRQAVLVVGHRLAEIRGEAGAI
jgi:hypothetical protein